MEISYLVIPVLIGFWVKSHLQDERVRFRASSNAFIAYESAVFGGVLFGAVWLLTSIAKTPICWVWNATELPSSTTTTIGQVINFVERLDTTCFDDHLPFPLMDSLILTAFAAIVYTLAANRKSDELSAILSWTKEARELGAMLVAAWEEDNVLMVTTIRNDVYAGQVIKVPFATSKQEILDISLVPYFEGHIDEKDGAVHITVDRLDAIEFQLAYSLVIPTSEIASIRNFETAPNVEFVS